MAKMMLDREAELQRAKTSDLIATLRLCRNDGSACCSTTMRATERPSDRGPCRRCDRGETRQLSSSEITAIAEALGGLIRVLEGASPEDRAEVYRQLEVNLAYDPGVQQVRPCRRGSRTMGTLEIRKRAQL